MEDEALQCAEVCPAELVDHRIHPSDHLPLVWLACKENKHTPSEHITFDPLTWRLGWRTARRLIRSLPMALRNSSYSSKVMRGLGRSRSHCLRTLAMTWML